MPLQHLASTYGPHKSAHTCVVHMYHLTHKNTYTHWSCHRFHGQLRSCRRMGEFLPLSSVVFSRIPTLDTKKQTEAKTHRQLNLCFVQPVVPVRKHGEVGMDEQTGSHQNRAQSICMQLFPSCRIGRELRLCACGREWKTAQVTMHQSNGKRKKKSFLIKIKCPL